MEHWLCGSCRADHRDMIVRYNLTDKDLRRPGIARSGPTPMSMGSSGITSETFAHTSQGV